MEKASTDSTGKKNSTGRPSEVTAADQAGNSAVSGKKNASGKKAENSAGSGKKNASGKKAENSAGSRKKNASGKKAENSAGKWKGSSKRTFRQGDPAETGRNRKTRKASRKQPVTESFRHAFDGLFAGLQERNMKIHCTMAVLVVFFGALLRISVTEWCMCLILFGLIMGLELVNTAIEAVVDLVTEEYRPLAKKAKDTAAGAVLIAAVFAAITGLIIFVPHLLYALRSVL